MTLQPSAGPVTAPPDPREVASKVDLPPIIGVILGAWLAIGSSFVPYPFTPAGENASLRDRGLSLLLLLAAVCWARARTHRRRYLALYALLGAVLVVEALVATGGPGGELGAVSWNELVVGVLALLTAAAGWRGAGQDRPDPADTSEVDT